MKSQDERRIGSWRFAAGRVRSLEARLMDRGALERLATAEDAAAILHLLEEAGYQGRNIEEALAEENRRLFELLDEIAPTPTYGRLLLLEHDRHNLKLALRQQLLPDLPAYETYQSLMQEPSLLAPRRLDTLLREGRDLELPEPLQQAALQARETYAQTLDTARLDVAVDRLFAQHQALEAEALGNIWFIDYLTAVRDLKNLETLLRARRREIGAARLADSLLPAGDLQPESLLALFAAPVDELLDFVENSRYSVLLEAVRHFLSDRSASLSLASDSWLIEHLARSRHVLSGPEIPLAYLLARQLEMKSVRVVAAAVRNEWPEERRRGLVRPTIWERRA